MKTLLIIIFTAVSLHGVSQVHRLGLTGGINSVLSWDSKVPPFGEGSPFSSTLGYSGNLSYSYIFNSNLTLSLRNSFTSLNFQADNSFAFVDHNNDIVRADLKYFQLYYHTSIGGGYLFQMGKQYAINAEGGASMLYRYKDITYSAGYPDTRVERKREWEEGNRFYGLFLTIDHYYCMYRTKDYGVFLTGSLRFTQIFDYAVFGSNRNRTLPELTLGMSVAFGNQRSGRRF